MVDIDGDDQDAWMGATFFENIGNSNTPLFSQTSQIPLPNDFIIQSPILVDLNGDSRVDSIIDTTNGLRLLHNGIEPVTDIVATTLTGIDTLTNDLILVSNRPSQIQIQLCDLNFFSNNSCRKTIVLPFSAQELSVSTGHFDADIEKDIVLAMIDGEGNLKVNVYNHNLVLIGSGTGGAAKSIAVSAGQLDADPEDEGVVSYVRPDGRVAAVSFNLNATLVGKVVVDEGTQPSVAVGDFNDTHDAFVLAYLNPDEQIKTTTFRGDGTLLSQGEGGKSSHLTVIASDILSNFPGDEYVTSIIQEDGRAGLIGFSADSTFLDKVVGDVSQQPQVISGHFPGVNNIGLAASIIQSDQKPAILFLDNKGKLLAKGIAGTTATIATLTLADTNGDGIDKGILVYVDESGLPRWEVFAADGTKK